MTKQIKQAKLNNRLDDILGLNNDRKKFESIVESVKSLGIEDLSKLNLMLEDLILEMRGIKDRMLGKIIEICLNSGKDPGLLRSNIEEWLKSRGVKANELIVDNAVERLRSAIGKYKTTGDWSEGLRLVMEMIRNLIPTGYKPEEVGAEI